MIVGLDENLTVPAETFTKVLDTTETTELEPDEFEHKFYAPGVGLVLIQEDFEEGEPQTVIPLLSVEVIPSPPALVPRLVTLTAAAGFIRLRRRVQT